MRKEQKFAEWKPKRGESVTYMGRQIGKVTNIDGGLCYVDDKLQFIWCFGDGLNSLHDWPSAAGGPRSFCPCEGKSRARQHYNEADLT